MGKWEMVPISDMLFFQEGPGVRNIQYTSSGVKLLNVANLQDGKVDLSTSDRYISENEAYGKYSHFLVDEGDLIIASSGIQVNYFEKKMGFVSHEQLPLCMNTSTIRFKALDKTRLCIKFFMYYLKTPQFKIQLEKLITGSAQLNFGPSHIKKMSFPLPPLCVQEKITDVLERANTLIEKRKAQIEKLDLLVKSQFVEMFGDPVANPMGWEVSTLKEVSIGKLSYGSGASATNYDGETRYVRITDITDNGELNNDMVSPSNYDKKYLLRDGDILFARSGATVGKTFRYSSSYGKCIYAGYLIRLIPDTVKVLPDYVFAYTKTKYYHDFIAINQKTVAQPNINAQQYGDLEICAPPLSLQTQFATFVERVETQKARLKKSLALLELNYKSLMQKCFNGEIF